MARHRTPDEKRELGERARALRAQGRSLREITAELRVGEDLLRQLLAGTEVPDSLRRPRAKDDLREVAVQLRTAGLSYNGIAAELGVSKSSLSLWLRDLPAGPGQLAPDPPETVTDTDHGGRPPRDSVREAARDLRVEGLLLKEIAARLGVSVPAASRYTRGLPWPARSRHGGDAAHVRAMSEARWAPHRRNRDATAQQRKLEAANAVGALDDMTLLLLGAIAYWCEGSKSKPWRPHADFTFINSDPVLIRLFVLWLRMLKIEPDRWVPRVQIHETADVDAAEAYWRHVLGVDVAFGKAVIKRHKPLTKRQNVGDGYQGCLSIYVRRGRELLQQVEGWTIGALLGAGGTLPEYPVPWEGEECDTGEASRYH